MNLNDLQRVMAGRWSGKNLLRLSWHDPSEFTSSSLMTVAPAARERFLSFTYSWEHEGHPHEGRLLLGWDAEEKTATASWVDSWHMSNKVMFCQGSIDGEGTVDLRGSYAAPPGPDWGWRIILSAPIQGTLRMVMYNCPPAGEEDLAVRAEYVSVRGK
jgi:hypothetical protein